MSLYDLFLGLRCLDRERIVEVIRDEFPLHDMFISPAIDGWVTIIDCDIELALPDITPLFPFSSTLASLTGCPVFIVNYLTHLLRICEIVTPNKDIIDAHCLFTPFPTDPIARQKIMNRIGEVLAILKLDDRLAAVMTNLESHDELSSELIFSVAKTLGILDPCPSYRTLFMHCFDSYDGDFVPEWKSYIHLNSQDLRRGKDEANYHKQ